MELIMARINARLTPSLSLIIACALWAGATVLSKQLLGSVPAVLFLIIQLVPSTLALWIVTIRSRTVLPRGRILCFVVLLGWLNPGLSYTLSMLGLVHVTASVATLLWAAEPALIVILAWLMLHERVNFAMIALTASAAFGVYLASGLASQNLSLTGQTYGALLILSGVLCCALYTVVSRDIAAGTDPLAIVAIQQTTGLAWALSIWPFELQGPAMAVLTNLTLAELLGGFASGLMYYALAFWFYLNGLRSMSASRAGSFFNLIPIFGIALAWIFLGEQLSFVQWAGALLIVASIITLQLLTPALPE
jgi:drug/metabolite transporter (DMT)-like permease